MRKEFNGSRVVAERGVARQTWNVVGVVGESSVNHTKSFGTSLHSCLTVTCDSHTDASFVGSSEEVTEWRDVVRGAGVGTWQTATKGGTLVVGSSAAPVNKFSHWGPTNGKPDQHPDLHTKSGAGRLKSAGELWQVELVQVLKLGRVYMLEWDLAVLQLEGVLVSKVCGICHGLICGGTRQVGTHWSPPYFLCNV